METPPQFYSIRDLVLLPELNPRAQLCEETIIRYMESFGALPPVSIQEGTGVLVDGFHRVEAATRLGAEMIPVRMLDIPDEELHLHAGLANCDHGRALNRAERNHFVVRLVEEYGWPAEKVARVVGVSHSSVSLAVREHRYNQELSERLGEEVQVINSSHVQALYRVGDEQRARLLDAVARKTDEDGRPRPLTGAELKSLVDRMEDPATSAEELQRLFEDPLLRPEALTRRRATTTSATDGSGAAAAAGSADETAAESGTPAAAREVGRRGPLSDGGSVGPFPGDQRARLLERALAPAGEDAWNPAAHEDRSAVWSSEGAAPWGERRARPERVESDRPAPLGLEAPGDWGSAREAAPAAVLERAELERGPVDALGEAERLLCDLCARIEDAELWEQVRTARDLVREAGRLLGCQAGG